LKGFELALHVIELTLKGGHSLCPLVMLVDLIVVKGLNPFLYGNSFLLHLLAYYFSAHSTPPAVVTIDGEELDCGCVGHVLFSLLLSCLGDTARSLQEGLLVKVELLCLRETDREGSTEGEEGLGDLFFCTLESWFQGAGGCTRTEGDCEVRRGAIIRRQRGLLGF